MEEVISRSEEGNQLDKKGQRDKEAQEAACDDGHETGGSCLMG